MKEIVYLMAVCGFTWNAGRLLDIAWPTEFFGWRFYAAFAAMWLVVASIFHP